MQVADEERRRFERDLHDGVQQQLIAVRIQLASAAEETNLDSATRRRLNAIGDGVQVAIDEIREVGQGLSPPVLSEYGLVAALRSIQQRGPRPLILDTDGTGRYSPGVESAVYYCCLEAIQNATKHGGPDVSIAVKLRVDGDHLRFEVKDDGAGFASELIKGSGLQNMQDRLGALGGRLTVRSAPGQGTVVSGSLLRSTGTDP